MQAYRSLSTCRATRGEPAIQRSSPERPRLRFCLAGLEPVSTDNNKPLLGSLVLCVSLRSTVVLDELDCELLQKYSWLPKFVISGSAAL
jgi:hypothetical protein